MRLRFKAQVRGAWILALVSALVCPVAMPLAASLPKVAIATPELNMVELVLLARTHSPGLRSAKENVNAAEHAAKSAMGALLPQISLSANRDGKDLETLNAPPVPHTEDRTRSQHLGFVLRQKIWDWSAWQEWKTAQLRADQESLRSHGKAQDLAREVLDTSLAILKQQRALQSWQEEEATASQSLQKTKLRHQSGAIPKLDVYEAEAAWAGVKSARLQAQQALSASQASLNRLVGLPVQILDFDEASETLGKDVGTLDEWLAYAAEHNATTRIARLQKRIRENELRSQTGSMLLPTVQLEARINADNNDKAYAPATGHSNEKGIAVTLNWPLFSGGTSYHSTKKSQSQLLAAEADLQSAEEDANKSVSIQHQRLTTGLEVLAARKEAVQANKAKYLAVEKAYEVGSRTLYEVLDARGKWFTALRQLDEARYDTLAALNELRYVTGQLDLSYLESLSRYQTPRPNHQPIR